MKKDPRVRHRSHLRLLAMTTFRQCLHASDAVSPNCGCGEKPSSIFNKFIPNGSLEQGMGWWSPALPARPWLFHLHPPEGRVHSPLPPHQPTSPVRQQRALPNSRGPLGQTVALGHGAGEAAVQWLLSPEPSPHGAKLPPTIWNYEPSTAVRLHRARFPRAALAEVTILPGKSKKFASFCKKSARCIPGFGMNRHMDKHQKWMKKHSISLRIIY